MKIIHDIFDSLRPLFASGKKLHMLEPMFEATENFFFSTGVRTSEGPHIRNSLDIKRYMSMVILALIPSVLAGFYFFGWRIIPVILTSYIVGGLVEVLVACLRKEEINEGFLVTGLLFPLVLPPSTPLWVVAIGVAFGVFFGKEIFGGTGRNLFNPAITGRCFVGLAYPTHMAGWVEPTGSIFGRVLDFWPFSALWGASAPEAVTTATPLVAVTQGQPSDYFDMFVGNITGCIGETSTLAILLGGIFLIAFKIANWRTTVSTLVSFFILSAFMHHLNSDKFPPALYHLMAGGIMFGAVFMVTDPVTCPSTNIGKYIYGILIGCITVLIRNLGGYAEGMMFAILLGNVAAPIIDVAVLHFHVQKFKPATAQPKQEKPKDIPTSCSSCNCH